MATTLTRHEYVDPVLSVEFDSKSLSELTRKFPPYYSKITQQCSVALKTYKHLLSVQSQTKTWEFSTLKVSVDLNFNTTKNNVRTFDIKIAQTVLQKCNTLDEELDKHATKLKHLIDFIKGLTVEEYISDPGTLLLKVYFKTLNLKNSLAEQISVSYTKAKLLVIKYELGQIMVMIDAEENPITLDNTDFQSTLNSYKDFVSVLIDQLDRAVLNKDSDQIEECLGILSDVEKMYESVRMNFFFTEELNEWEHEYQEQEQMLLNSAASTSTEFSSSASSPRTSELGESYQMSRFLNEKPSHSKVSRRGSMSSTTSSIGTFMSRPATTTISEELPYLMQAFDEARELEQELSAYQPPKKTMAKSPTARNLSLSPSSSTSFLNKGRPGAIGVSTVSTTAISTGDKTKPHLESGFSTPNMGFNSPLLNSLYGLHPTSTPFTPSNLHNEVD